jgi:hypothetical protein
MRHVTRLLLLLATASALPACVVAEPYPATVVVREPPRHYRHWAPPPRPWGPGWQRRG